MLGYIQLSFILTPKKTPINANMQKLKKAPIEPPNTYLKEQLEYIQGHIDKIKNLVDNRHSQLP